MPDPVYREFPFLFMSKGIQARMVDDTVPPEFYINLDNCEELYENSFSQRLGSILVNVTGSTGNPLSGGAVTTLSKLSGLNGSAWRYAGDRWREPLPKDRAHGRRLHTDFDTVSGSPMWAVSL